MTPATVADVLIDDGRIVEVAAAIDAPGDAHEIDARDCWVGPGFVDLHTHLREPGREAAETIESGARAGALGGYCALVAMPNTEPALDSVALVSYVLERGAHTPLDVAVAGAITVGRHGEALAPMAEMAALGVRLFTDDGLGVQDPSVMRRALTYAKPLGVRLAQHCEDERLAAGGTMNEGALSGRLGLIGRPALAEEIMVLRDIELVRLTGAPLHFLHLSTRTVDRPGPRGARRGTAGQLRGGTASLHARRGARAPRTTRSSRSTRRCAQRATSRDCATRFVAARSTPWRPITRRTRPN